MKTLNSKAALTNTSLLTMATCIAEGANCRNKSTDNYEPTL